MRPGCLWHTPTTEDADWLFVVGASFLAAVCTTNTTSTTATIGGHPLALSDPTRSVIESLWARVDEPGVAIEEIVGTMPLGAEGGVRSFAIVTFGDQPAPDQTDRTVTAVVRGSAVVDVFSVGGSRRFSSGGVQPWMLADFRSVTAVTLGGGDQPTQPMAVLGRAALPFAGGVVRGQRMLWSLQPLTFASAEFSADADAGEAADRADATQVEGDARDAVDDASASAPTASVAIGSVPTVSVATASADELDHTILSPNRFEEQLAPDDTVFLPRSGMRAAPTVPSPRQPTAAGSAPHRFRLVGCAPRPLTEPAVFGRHPVGPRMLTGVAPQLITVESADAAVSAVHLRIEQQGGTVIVTDLHSRNGTAVRPPGGVARRLHPGEAVVVLVGTTIDIGDGNIIEIMPPNSADQPGSTVGPIPGGAA